MIDWLAAHAVDALAVLGALYALALAIVKLTPTPRDDEAVERAGAVLRAIAKVFGLDLRQGRRASPKVGGRANTRALLALAIAASLLAACASPGTQYQASAVAFVAAVDGATELRRAGELDEAAVADVGEAIDLGHRLLREWGDALERGEDYPAGPAAVGEVVRAIRSHLERLEE